jgi:hypothetical protein
MLTLAGGDFMFQRAPRAAHTTIEGATIRHIAIYAQHLGRGNVIEPILLAQEEIPSWTIVSPRRGRYVKTILPTASIAMKMERR